ncbi:hypothetical protein IGI65_001667 [Enterococcus sp. DIV0755b]|uniref:distal tail protein Dit n=1 Tax=Enterococcus sp. DIV0755b TaxID=2774657 RepID=UPI003F2568E9
MISDLVITYDGDKLTDYFDLTAEPAGRNIQNRENSIQQMGLTNGSHFIGSRYTERIITLNIFSDRYSVEFIKNKINGLLNVKEPKPMIFSDRPNEVWYAILDGESIMTRSIDSLTEVSGELSFLVPAGYCEALIPSKYTATPNDDGILAMQIANNGTETAELSFEATMTSDNGFLGAVGPLGAMEFGSIEELDGHNYQKTDIVAKNSLKPDDQKNWELNSAKAGTVYPIAVSGIRNRFGEGSFKWNAGSEGPEPVFPTNTTACWVGPTLYRDIPKNSNEDNTKNFEAIWRCNFKTTKVKEAIREEFNLMSGNKVVASIVLRDSMQEKVEGKFELAVILPDGTKFRQDGTIDLKKATGSWYDVRISRIGPKVTFRISQIKKLGSGDEVAQSNWQYQKMFTLADFENVPITGTTYWPHTRYLNAAVPPLNSKKESITNFVFRWINVDKWSDDPNRYSEGDVLSYDGTTGKFYVNEVLAMNDIIIGSTDLKIPPGFWIVEFHYSNFGKTPPNIVGTLRERWL